MKAEVENLSKEIEVRKQEKVKHGRAHLNRGTKILRQRILKKGMTQWKAAVTSKEGKEANVEFIKKRLVKKLYGNAF